VLISFVVVVLFPVVVVRFVPILRCCLIPFVVLFVVVFVFALTCSRAPLLLFVLYVCCCLFRLLRWVPVIDCCCSFTRHVVVGDYCFVLLFVVCCFRLRCVVVVGFVVDSRFGVARLRSLLSLLLLVWNVIRLLLLWYPWFVVVDLIVVVVVVVTVTFVVVRLLFVVDSLLLFCCCYRCSFRLLRCFIFFVARFTLLLLRFPVV